MWAQAGVGHIILAVSYRAELLEEEMSREAELLGVKITFSLEEEPLGTGSCFPCIAHTPFWIVVGLSSQITSYYETWKFQ